MLRRERLKTSRGVIPRQIRASEHVQQMQLDSTGTALPDIARGLDDLFVGLAGQTDDLVDDRLQPGLL